MNRLGKFLLVLVFLVHVNVIKAQEGKSLFQSDSVLKLTIKLSLKEVLEDLDERSYREAKLSYIRPDGTKSKHKLKVKVRGNFRSKVSTCKFPPLKLNFKKNKLENSIFQGQNKIKLVTHCNKNKNAEQLILKEYLVYKLYQQVSNYSFKVRLCEITYIDVSNNDETSTHFGFFIEDIDDLAMRNDMLVFEDSILNQDACNREELDKLTVFEFMIGNLDWSVPNRHNMKLISTTSSKMPIAVPYDFDFAGFVGAPYAKPPVEFDVQNVKTRFFMGLCRLHGGYDQTILFYKQKKDELLAVVAESPYLNEKNKKTGVKYLENFFTILDKQNQLDTKIVKACRANHKHIYQYEQ